MVKCLQRWLELPLSFSTRSRRCFTLQPSQIRGRGLWHDNEVQGGGNGVCFWVISAQPVSLCVHALCEMTDVSDHNLCPTTLWTPVFPGKILKDSPVQCGPDLLNPTGLPLPLLGFSVCVPHTHFLTHAHIYRHNPHPAGPQKRKGEKWLLSFFLF